MSSASQDGGIDGNLSGDGSPCCCTCSVAIVSLVMIAFSVWAIIKWRPIAAPDLPSAADIITMEAILHFRLDRPNELQEGPRFAVPAQDIPLILGFFKSARPDRRLMIPTYGEMAVLKIHSGGGRTTIVAIYETTEGPDNGEFSVGSVGGKRIYYQGASDNDFASGLVTAYKHAHTR